MDAQTAFWMIVMLLIYFGGFTFFASIASKSERNK